MNVQAEGCRCFGVYSQRGLGRLLGRQISRFGTSQYPINIGDNWPTVLRNEVKRVLIQSTIGGRIEIWVDRGQPVPGVQLDDQLAIGEIKPLRRGCDWRNGLQ